MVLDGAGLGMAMSPVLTQALTRVPLARAADASGVLTTTMQLTQVVGVAVFGTLYLSLHASAAATACR